MATPVGHTLLGVTLARRMGVESPFGLGASVVAASLPDIDVIAGLALHRDPWKLHRKTTHTLGFMLTAGMLAGFAGILRAGSNDGERDLVADALTGAVVVGSHWVLDYTPFPYLPTKKSTPAAHRRRNAAVNWLIDAVFYGAIAYRFWPRHKGST